MSIPTSSDFTMTRNDIIMDALLMLNVFGVDETPPAADYTFCARALIRMVKAWQAQGHNLFQKRIGYVFMQKAQDTYTLNSTGDHATLSYVTTTTSAAASAAATAIVGTAVTGMAAADYIGIELSTGYLQWTTISSIASTTINLGAALTSSVASGARVYTYTTRLAKPMRIHSIQRRYMSTNPVDTMVTPLSSQEYQELSMKTQSGTPTNAYYDTQINYGDLIVWPVPSHVLDILVVEHEKTIADFDSTTDNPDFPTYWLDAIVSNLAVRIAPAYGKYTEASAIMQIGRAHV